jgi:hypothetical protein
VLAHLALDVAAQARARVVHRQEHPRDRQPRVELALDELERVEQAGEALEREVLGLHRDDHAVGGDQRVDGQRPERGRAVEQRVGEAVADRRERVAQPPLGARLLRQLDGRAGQIGVRGQQLEALDLRRAHGVRRVGAAREDVVDARLAELGRPQPDRRVGLRVDVDEQRRVAGLRDAGGDVDRGGRLADAALLVRDRVHGAHRAPRYRRPRSASHDGSAPNRRVLDPQVKRPSGRLRAIPARRGKRGGGSLTFV